MNDKMLELGYYRHFKGNVYEVIANALHSETEEELVVYKALGEEQVWVRLQSMWNEVVERDGKTMSRFEKVEDSLMNL